MIVTLSESTVVAESMTTVDSSRRASRSSTCGRSSWRTSVLFITTPRVAVSRVVPITVDLTLRARKPPHAEREVYYPSRGLPRQARSS